MALPLRRNAHFAMMISEGALAGPWASFLRHLPRETLILRKGARSTTAAPTQHRRRTGALEAPESASGGRGGVFIYL